MKKHLLMLIASAQIFSALNAGQFNVQVPPCEFVHYAEQGNIRQLENELLRGENINQAHPDTGWTALHTALHNGDMRTISFLLDHGASIYRKTKKGLTARHFLKGHTASCFTSAGDLTCKNNPCIPRWPAALLEKINGPCMICREPIAEIGTIYDCGHVIHEACAHNNEIACPQCEAPTFSRIIKAQECDSQTIPEIPVARDIPWDEILQELPHDPSAFQDNRIVRKSPTSTCQHRDTCTSAQPCSRCRLLITTKAEEKIVSDAAALARIQQTVALERDLRLQRIHNTMSQHAQRLYQAWQKYQHAEDTHQEEINRYPRFKKEKRNAPTIDQGTVSGAQLETVSGASSPSSQCSECHHEKEKSNHGTWQERFNHIKNEIEETEKRVAATLELNRQCLERSKSACILSNKPPVSQNWRHHCLFEAAKSDLQEVKERLIAGESPNKGYLYKGEYGKGGALHAALFNNKQDIARCLMQNGADPLVKDQYNLTCRQALQRHTTACKGKHEIYEKCGMHGLCPDADTNWSKELLLDMNGICVQCNQIIEEVGHIFDCGHVIHKACAASSAQCLECHETLHEKLDRLKKQNEKIEKQLESREFLENRKPGHVSSISAQSNEQEESAATNPSSANDTGKQKADDTEENSIPQSMPEPNVCQIAPEGVVFPFADQNDSYIPTRNDLHSMTRAQLCALTREQHGNNHEYIVELMQANNTGKEKVQDETHEPVSGSSPAKMADATIKKIRTQSIFDMHIKDASIEQLERILDYRTRQKERIERIMAQNEQRRATASSTSCESNVPSGQRSMSPAEIEHEMKKIAREIAAREKARQATRSSTPTPSSTPSTASTPAQPSTPVNASPTSTPTQPHRPTGRNLGQRGF